LLLVDLPPRLAVYAIGHRARKEDFAIWPSELKEASSSQINPFAGNNGKVKTALMGSEFEGECDLLDGILGVLNAIPGDEIEAVFDE
jgi:hypothetical protein